MSEETSDFAVFMKRREAAGSNYICGDAGPLDQLVATTPPASFFSPRGDYVDGAEEVKTRYDSDVSAFAPGGDSRFEILHMASDGDLGYWVGFQRATTYMQGQEDPVEFNLRITELFRREDGQWKLIHRHADPLKMPSKD